MVLNCLNCGEPVSKNFCPTCGQSVEDRRRSLLSLLGEFTSEFLSWDGRHLKTSAKLWSPGRLTQLFFEGKRASFVPPVRIYFVTSLLFFLFVGFPVPDADGYNVYVGGELIGRDAPSAGLPNIQLSGRTDRSQLGKTLAPLFQPQFEKLQAMPAQKLLDGFFAGLERTVPTTLIFFVPILALAIKLLYIRQPFFYVDHLVFALHFQSFLFVLLVLAHFANVSGLARVSPGPVTYLVAFFILTPIYLLLALRRVYGQGWWLASMKTAVLGMLYLVLIQPVMLMTGLLIVRSM